MSHWLSDGGIGYLFRAPAACWGCSAGLRPAPAEASSNGNGNGRSGFPVGWRGGSGGGGRCKYVHVSSVAASMRLTPPQPDPPRLRQFPATCRRSTPCVDESSSKSNISRIEQKASTHGVDRPCRPRSTPTHSNGNLSEAGRCRSAGCQPHGPEACLGRVGQDAQPRSCRVRRKAHTSKRLPSLHGRTCGVPALRHRPAKPRNPAFALAVDLASAGAGRSPAETHPQELQDNIEQPARLSAHAGRLPA